MSDNIIKFPKGSAARPPQNHAELAQSLEDNKISYCNELIDHYASQLLHKFGMHGFRIDDEQFMADFAFTVETLRSMLSRSLGVEHPFQDMIAEALEQMDEIPDHFDFPNLDPDDFEE